jgi:hypothetical protein
MKKGQRNGKESVARAKATGPAAPRPAARQLGQLASAAAALEAELTAFEQVAATALRTPLTSQRNVDKAARSVSEAAAAQGRVGQHIHTLLAALNEARAQNEKTAVALQARGQEIQARAGEISTLLTRFEQIGRAAAAVSQAVKIMGGEAARAEPDGVKVEALSQIDARMGEIVAEAQALTGAAREAGLEDVSQQADGLRQQMHSARNKVGLLLTRLREQQVKH